MNRYWLRILSFRNRKRIDSGDVTNVFQELAYHIWQSKNPKSWILKELQKLLRQARQDDEDLKNKWW